MVDNLLRVRSLPRCPRLAAWQRRLSVTAAGHLVWLVNRLTRTADGAYSIEPFTGRDSVRAGAPSRLASSRNSLFDWAFETEPWRKNAQKAPRGDTFLTRCAAPTQGGTAPRVVQTGSMPAAGAPRSIGRAVDRLLRHDPFPPGGDFEDC